MLAHQAYQYPNLLIIHFKLLGSHVSKNSNRMDDGVHGLFLNKLRQRGNYFFFFLTAVTFKSQKAAWSLSPPAVFLGLFIGVNFLQCEVVCLALG